MASISHNIKDDWEDMYDGYDSHTVGLGTISPNIYASDRYRKRKQDKLLIGGLSEIVYAGMEHDRMPMVWTMGYEPAYNTVIGWNAHYVPIKIRMAMAKFILETNVSRIKSNQPLMLDYHAMKRRIPESQYIVRRYKTVGIHVVGNIPLADWKEALQKTSTWSNHYRMYMHQ